MAAVARTAATAVSALGTLTLYVDTDAVDKENAFILRLRPALTDPSARSH